MRLGRNKDDESFGVNLNVDFGTTANVIQARWGNGSGTAAIPGTGLFAGMSPAFTKRAFPAAAHRRQHTPSSSAVPSSGSRVEPSTLIPVPVPIRPDTPRRSRGVQHINRPARSCCDLHDIAHDEVE